MSAFLYSGNVEYSVKKYELYIVYNMEKKSMEKQSDTTGITKSYMEKILEQRQGFIIINWKSQGWDVGCQ